MNKKLPHLYLRNPFGVANKFNKSRAITDTKFEEKDPEAYRHHKQKLHASFVQLKQDRTVRLQQKTLVPANIEIVEIRFLIPFSNGANFNTRTRFLDEFGLSPVMQRDFNRTILFAIVDDAKFRRFDALLNQYIQSDNRTSPQRTPYAIMTTLYDVKYHTAADIRNNCSNDLVFEFINNNQYVDAAYEAQREVLKSHLEGLALIDEIDSFTVDPYDKMIQIKGASRDIVVELAKNFDILAQAHSLRSLTVKPDQFNTAQLAWDLNIRNDEGTNTIVGILDNGIRPIDPVRDIIEGGFDVTSTNDALSANHRHGTVVASLAAVGDRYFTGENELMADARIYSIKILESIDGYIDIIKVVEAIRHVHRDKGIRLFNLSVCAQSKGYNESPSLFAYLLDKLAYEEDILIFIAAGNMSYDDLVAMQENPHDLHNYPNHYYNPGASSDIHSCEFTNICTPAESMNHITVGALADNFRDTPIDLSLDKNLPAYYSRKNHYDFKQEINGGKLSPNHSNKNLFKPDIVMPGGDLLRDEAAMQVLGFGEVGTDYYVFDAGTSLATPLALNLAVQLINLYPDISLQSVKALMINSANSYSHDYLENIVDKRKETLSNRIYERSFEDLARGEKMKITKQVLSAEDIHRNLAGYGKPNLEELLYSTDNEVSLLIEGVIPTDHHKVVLVNIPDYLLDSTNSKCLDIQATLCFKINPAWGNHVDYNPLHISFNFANSVIKDSLNDLAAIISDRDHDFYRDYWTDEIRALQLRKDRGGLSDNEKEKLSGLKLTAKNQALGVKKTIESWSEDFFPLVNKPLSNRQQMAIKLAKQDIQKIGNQLVIVMRCAVKENLDIDLQEWSRTTTQHPFSLAIRIEDTSKINEERSLYNELQMVNTVEVINNTIADLDQDLEAEA